MTTPTLNTNGELKKRKINISASELKLAYEYAVVHGKYINNDNVITLHIAEDNAMIYYSVSKVPPNDTRTIDITNYNLF